MDIVRFLKDWTLPVAIVAGSATYLLFAYVPALENVGLAMAPLMDALLPVAMFLVLFVTFCKVDFRALRPVRWHLWTGVFQVAILALLMAIVLTYRPEGQDLVIMEALLTCVVAPCASAAPVVTQKLGGRIEEMTAYTLLSNIVTALFIPLCFPLVERSADITFTAAFLKILREVCLVLLMPMLLAYVVKHHAHGLHRRVVGVKDLSYYLWACSLLIVSGTTVRNICHAEAPALFLLLVAALGLLLCIVQFAVGRYIGHYFGRIVESGQGLGQKNTTFAIWIAHTYLTPLSSIGPGCYILWQNIINSVEIWRARKQQAKWPGVDKM